MKRGLVVVAIAFAIEVLVSAWLVFSARPFEGLVAPLSALIASVVITIGLVHIALNVERPELAWGATAAVAASAFIDLAIQLLTRSDFMHSFAWGFAPVTYLSLLLAVAERALVAWLLVSLCTSRRGLAAMLGVTMFGAVLVRIAHSVAVSAGLLSWTDDYQHTFKLVLSVSGFVIGASGIALAMLAMPKQEVGHHTVAAERSSPMTGAAILLIGFVVATIPVDSASNTGRYIFATGAFIVGLSLVIRGFITRAKRA